MSPLFPKGVKRIIRFEIPLDQLPLTLALLDRAHLRNIHIKHGVLQTMRKHTKAIRFYLHQQHIGYCACCQHFGHITAKQNLICHNLIRFSLDWFESVRSCVNCFEGPAMCVSVCVCVYVCIGERYRIINIIIIIYTHESLNQKSPVSE